LTVCSIFTAADEVATGSPLSTLVSGVTLCTK
jgi:hypothetical protein